MSNELHLTESHFPAVSEPLPETTVGDVLRGAAAEAADLLAIVDGCSEADGARRRWTFGETLVEAEATARYLHELFEPGDRLVVWAPSSPEWEFLELGAAMAGVVIVTANPALTRGEITYVLDNSQAVGIAAARQFRGANLLEVVDSLVDELPDLREVFCIDDLLDLIERFRGNGELPKVQPGDPFMIQYTSGTTGFPKAVVLLHRNVTAISESLGRRLQAEPRGVWINPLPMFHVGGSVLVTLGSLWLRAAHCIVREFEPGAVLELIEEERGEVLPAVPTMLYHLLDHPDRQTRDLSSLQRILSGGATIPAELVRRIQRELGVSYSTMYGLTETSSVVTQSMVTDTAEDLATTAGPPLEEIEVKVVEPATGATLPINTAGELLVRGPGNLAGYFNVTEGTTAALEPDGWFHTGDLGTMDPRGYVQITGRLKEVIIRGGENIYPAEIEHQLYEHPDVAEAAVLGKPDEMWGEVVAAVVRLHPGRQPDADELMTFLRARLASQKVPRHWEFVESLPVTPSGKIKKFELRARFDDDAP